MAEPSSNAEHGPSCESAGERGEARSVLPEPSVDALSYAETRDRVFEALLDQPRQVQRLGRYVVLDTLGRGGMGKVLDAYDPSLDRRVALKVLHRDLAARHRRRLVREAKVMARFSHPHVVQVYEVGEAEGRTFVAMERVRGQTLGEWMRQRPGPGWRECVRVFVQAGEGLAAAHAKGVVHRDFKPGNALVDEEGRARVLDFGLARTLEEPAPDSAEPSREDDPRAEPAPSHAAEPGEPVRVGLDSPLTRTGSVMGTPAYMAPEQMAGQPADARSDQFAFCVSLYEALYGERPFEGRSVSQLRAAMEQGMVRPAARGVAVPEVLRRVVLRGLAREPEQRWPSMEALLDRLRRAIAPRRQGWVALALLGGLAAIGVGIVYQAEVGRRCEGAETRLEGIWDEARRDQVRQAILGTGLSYAPGTWERVAPRLDAYARAWAEAHTEVCEATSVRHEQSAEVMDLRMACLGERLFALDQAAAVLAEANETRVRGAVDLVARLPALARCDDVAALRAAMPPPEDPRVAQQVEALRRRIERARSLEKAGEYDEALDLVRGLAPEAESLGYEPLLAEVLHHRGRLTSRSGRFAEAEPDLARAYGLAIEHGHGPIAIGAATDLVWNVGYRQARPEEGLWWARTALPLARSEQGEPRLEVEALNSVGAVLELQGKIEEALQHQRRALAAWEEEVGADDPYVAYLLSNIGISLDRQGEVEAALGYHRRALAIVESTLGPEHPEIGRTLDDIGVVLYGMGELDAAFETFERALAIKERGLGPTHPSVAYSHNNLGDLLHGRGRDEEALMHLHRSVEIFEEAVGPEHPNLASPLHNLAGVLRDLGRFDEAWRSDQRGLEITEASLGPEHPNVAYNLLGLAETALARHEPAAALPHAERALAIREHHEVSPAELAQALFTVTRACWSEPELRPRAHALAERAHALQLEHGVVRSQAERIERWLETHPLP